jgi:hypothetical protein
VEQAGFAEFGEGELRELERAGVILKAAFIVDSELFAGVGALGGLGSNNFVPEGGGLGVVTAALGVLREFAAGLGADFVGQAEVEGLSAGGLCALGVAATMEEAGETEEVAAVDAAVLLHYCAE